MHNQRKGRIEATTPPPRRVVQLHLRCTPDQKERIEQKAAVAGESVSAFVIRAALTRVPPITNDQLLELGMQLARLGLELNNVVHWMNSYMDTSGTLWADVLSVYGSIRKAVQQLLYWVDEAPPLERFVPERVKWGSRRSQIHIRCTPRQKQRIQARAVRRRLTITDYLLTATLRRVERLDPSTVTRAYYLIQKIGNNLSQAVRVMNQTWSPEDGYADVYADYMDNVKGLFERAMYSDDILDDDLDETGG